MEVFMSEMRRLMMMFTRPVDSGGGGGEVEVPAPTILPASGNISPSQTISITISGIAVSAEYSTDNVNWVAYTAPFTLSGNTTVYARALDGDGNYSDVVSNSYIVLAYDSRVEYLESSGTQYIETGIIPDSDTGVYASVVCNDNVDSYFIGLRNNTGNTRFGVGHSSGGFYWCYGTYQTSNRLTGTTAEVWLNYLNDKKYVAKNSSTTKEATLPTLSITPAYNIRLFGSAGVVASYSKWNGKIYAVKITQGSDVVMDLIPVRKDGVGYMYDTVSGNLFGNSGTGSFTYGNDVTI